MRCDELKPLMCAHEPNVRPMYDKFEVDTAIAELKEAWRSEHEACKALKAELDKAIAERDGNQVCIDALKKELIPCLNGDCILTCEVVEKYGKENAELNARIADLEKLNHDLCDRVTENDDIRLHWEEIEQTRAENERLKQKLENVKASMYADVVDANMDNRRLRRALWLARAYRAEARKNYWYVRSIHDGDKYVWSIDGSAVKYIGCIKRTNFDWLKVWSEVESKCLAKAEEYK